MEQIWQSAVLSGTTHADLPKWLEVQETLRGMSSFERTSKVVPNIEYILEKPERYINCPNEDEQILLTMLRDGFELLFLFIR